MNSKGKRKHNQRLVSPRRPAYRDSKEEKAVKVYTINQESRYILVKGVPKISNITEEVLKPFSLYGTIQEYRILDDYPDIEEFTTVYWIKYVTIQSARVARRKMNKRSFFGSFLKVLYAPEHEDVEDTRQKLIERRKAVARRLRQLGRKEEEKADESSTTPNVTEENQIIPARGCSTESPKSNLPVEDMTGPLPEGGSTSSFPALPPPPTILPRGEWKDPQGAPLPGEYNHGTGNTNYDQNGNKGGQIRTNSTGNCNMVREGGSIFQRLRPQEQELPSSSPWVVMGKKSLDRRQQQQADRTNTGDGTRSKAVPRRRFAWANERTRNDATDSSDREQFLGQRLNPAPLPARNPAGKVGDAKASQPSQVPRQVRQGLKRRAEQHHQPLSGSCNRDVASSSSFDQTVASIRERMRQVQDNPSTSSSLPQQSNAEVCSPQPSGPTGHRPVSVQSLTNSNNNRVGSSEVNNTGQSSSCTRQQRRPDPNKRRRI